MEGLPHDMEATPSRLELQRQIDEMILRADLAVCAFLSMWLEEIRGEDDEPTC